MFAPPNPIAWVRRFGLLALCLSLLTGCGKDESPRPDAAPNANANANANANTNANTNVFTVLAGSELRDLEPLLPGIEKATGLRIAFKYTGTLEAVERIQAGEQFDAAWLASNRYALLTPGVKEKVLASERTMLTPVVLGIKRSKAQSLGWADAAGNSKPGITWKDIAQAAEKGRFTFGMTNPGSSNTGFSGLLGVAAALAGKGDALELKDINARELTAFFKAQTLTAGSSGWLADAYVKEQANIDGMINYAATLLALNASGKLSEPLSLIYPREGIITADYPVMALNAAKRADYDKLVAYLRTPEFQSAMAKQTWRKPVVAGAAFDATLYPTDLVELPFPAKLAVIDAVLQAFDNEIRRPADSSFVLDISGSMGGARMEQMKSALMGLTGLDTSLSGRFARLREREAISMTAFDHAVRPTASFSMDKAHRTEAEDGVRDYINALHEDGATAIFSAAKQVYAQAAARRLKAPDRYYSVVLLTDGENNKGMDATEFETWYSALPDNQKGIRIFAIQFGEARAEQLEALARLTGGRVFNATKTPLAQVFKEIRGYQ